MKKLVLGTLILLAAGIRPILAEEVRTLPPEVYGRMKNAGKIGQLWVNPKYDRSKSFTIGKVNSLATGLYTSVVDYFPYAFGRLAIAESTNVLSLTVLELSTVERPSAGYYSATVGLEGKVVDADGNLMLAFRTREEASNREDPMTNYKAAVDKIVWSLSKALGKDFQRTLEVKQELVQGHNPSGLVPQPPPPAEAPLDMKGRLMRLEDLRQKGLITQEEYQTHKEDILKGL